MATTSELYSFKGKEPKPLPNEIILPGGFTRTDILSFSEQEIRDAGYTGPYIKPQFDLETEYLEWNAVKMNWDVLEYPKPRAPFPTELLWRLRGDRSRLLKESDWRVMPDSPLSAEKQEEWKVYRQKLRDLPSQFYTKIDDNNISIRNLDTEEDFQNIVWPVVPSEE